MTADIIALALTAVVSMVVPLVILGIVWKKNPMERMGIFVTFGLGVVIYFVMQWGLKEHGLQYLFNHSSLMVFMNKHYILYMLCVAFAGAVFALIPQMLVLVVIFKKQMSFAKASMLALGYAMAESAALTGYRSISTIVAYFTRDDVEINTSTAELFMSCYERILFMVILTAVMVSLVYFVEQKMPVRGFLIALVCHTLLYFLPGFLIAFTTVSYIEVFDRTTALSLSYIVLTAGAVAGIAVMNALQYALRDERVDSKQAVTAFQKKQEEKLQKRQERKAGKKFRDKSAYAVSVIEGADEGKKKK
ncbi:MAG: hypothetical protein NC347_02480 [Clostridium sp.]|nr:hypothetical protein [Clostridium sp.]